MSTSLLYQGWGIRGYPYVRTAYVASRLIFTVKPDPFSVTCPVCCSHDVLQHGGIHRLWQEVPMIKLFNDKFQQSPRWRFH